MLPKCIQCSHQTISCIQFCVSVPDFLDIDTQHGAEFSNNCRLTRFQLVIDISSRSHSTSYCGAYNNPFFVVFYKL